MSSEARGQEHSVFHCGPFRLDVHNQQLWRGEQPLKLTPTAFALLRYLVEHAGRLVTKEELLQAVWPGTAVTEGVLTTHVRQIRQAPGEEAKAPQCIEIVHGRGYRFIAPVAERIDDSPSVLRQAQHERLSEPVILSPSTVLRTGLSKGDRTLELPDKPSIVVYSELGREEEARAEIAETLRINPNNSLEGSRPFGTTTLIL